MKRAEENPMDELHAIRCKNYKETKHLSPREQVRQLRKQADAAIEKYKIRFKTLEKTQP